MSFQKFHQHHGKNVVLLENQTVAFRKYSFAHGITFSDQPLCPMELFLIEIDKNERGWSGHLRIGLTQIDPNDQFNIPLYALPDLANISPKKSWIFAVTAMHNRSGVSDSARVEKQSQSFPNESGDGLSQENASSKISSTMVGDGDYLYTYQGYISKKLLRNLPKHKTSSMMQDLNTEEDTDYFYDEILENSDQLTENNNILPTDVGSRIGIMYTVKGDTAEMHFILNGEDMGAWAKDIPYKDLPLRAVIDVYGTTKQVKIIHLSCVSTLQNACRRCIRRHLRNNSINELPIPPSLKDFLRFPVI